MATDRTLGSHVAVQAFQLFRLLGFNSLADSLGVTGPERDEIEYMSGTAMGRVLVQRGTFDTTSPERLWNSFAAFYKSMGLGLVYWHRQDDGATVVGIEECAGCHGSVPVHRPICYVEAGLICGILSEALDEQYTAVEVKCIGGMGDHACEFVVQKK